MQNITFNYMLKKLALCLLSIGLIIILYGCSKPKPIHCDSPKITDQLIQIITSKNQEHSNYLTIKIAAISPQKNEQDLTCKAQVIFQHQLFPKLNFENDYTFIINHKQKQVTDLKIISKRQLANYSSWLESLPIIISFQKSHAGNLVIVQEPSKQTEKNKNQIQRLYFNGNLINLPDGKNYSTITIDRKFSLPNQQIFLISTYYNSLEDNMVNHNYFIDILDSNIVNVSPSFSYQSGSIEQKESDLIFAGIKEFPFAESDDYPIYSYQDSKLQLIRSSESANYYHRKFAILSARQILQQIKTDGCLNGDQFYLSDICSAKIITYCFKFDSLYKPHKDKSFWLLNTMCQNETRYP